MKELKGDAWDIFFEQDYDILCITTNGFVKGDGSCVMGKGIALQCKQQFPATPKILGSKILQNGNIPQLLISGKSGKEIWSFPTKHVWWEPADIELIKKSCGLLPLDKKIILPRPGCSNGKLEWAVVKEAIEPLLLDNVYVITW